MPGVTWTIGNVPHEIVYLHKESSRKNVNSASWLFLAMYDKILYKSRKEAREELFQFLAAEIRENIKDPGLTSVKIKLYLISSLYIWQRLSISVLVSG